ncbi:uncharacterized protein L969DRAFT_19541 [Mixia osmundae IAM 14324]|uniref:uncharacterized protein n=1 Tax=Mixia osmundae (strain CBS 9802 / IAM 14324 / JCM 22182 / KY 12970) TaxID=764103 RepID=UPI0004A555AF|nr:uncharacterized protein L969DRAFT_19541 [Mixia osmundae IAM 14324]KEI36986.1 hypothetical protein L969DRAFT_19541 [Mixia osmundae IAM 14324]
MADTDYPVSNAPVRPSFESYTSRSSLDPQAQAEPNRKGSQDSDDAHTFLTAQDDSEQEHVTVHSPSISQRPAISGATSRRDIWGFWVYSFASEVYGLVVLGLFGPVLLEAFAREHGVLATDHSIPCPSASSPALADSQAACVVQLAGTFLATASFSLLIASLGVFLQALTVISLAPLADDLRYRKGLLTLFAMTGSLAALAWLAVPIGSPLVLAPVLSVLGSISYSSSGTILNSYLPGLARGLPEVQALRKAAAPALLKQHSSSSHMQKDSTDTNACYQQHVSDKMSYISSKGIAFGSAAGIALMGLSLLPITILKGSTLALRIALASAGAWWLIFSIPALLLIRRQISGQDSPVTHTLLEGWSSLGNMIKERHRLKMTFRFLFAWFILSDSYSTITAVAILFARVELRMPASSIVFIGLLVPVFAIVGVLLTPVIQRYFNYSQLRMLTVLVFLTSLIPLYGCLGFVPASPLGIKSSSEMFVVSSVFGFLYGGFSSYSRVCYGSLIPRGQESRYFSLFAITDKSAAFIGPLLVGLLANATSSIRFAFPFLLFTLLSATPLLLFAVDMRAGTEAAHLYAQQDDLSNRLNMTQR